MSSREKLLALLVEIEDSRWCGSLKIEFHGGVPVEIDRSEAQKLTVGAFRPRGPGGQGLETR